MAAYTQCGMTRQEAIGCGDGTNARLSDWIGWVAWPRQKEASFIVLDANPLDDILNTRRIAAVYLRGKEVDRKGLRGKFMAASTKR